MTDVRPDFCQHRQLRALCRECIDPVRPPETDEEPWTVALPEPRGFSMFSLEVLVTPWAIATAAVTAALVAVLLLLSVGRLRR